MKRGCLCFCAVLFLSALPSLAGARRFTYLYEATTSPPGGFELENWVTWKTDTLNDHAFDKVDFRHEIEFGITDHFQLAVYLADWSYEDGRSGESEGFAYDDSALELIYNLSSPAADFLGLAIYGEIKAGYRTFELESKLIAQKDLGPLVIVYNATLEAIWQGEDLEEKEGEIQQSLGVSYEISPRLLAGVEVLHEIPIPEWRKTERSFFFAGPNVSVRGGKWWATATVVAQLTRAGDEPNFQLRTIVGYEF